MKKLLVHLVVLMLALAGVRAGGAEARGAEGSDALRAGAGIPDVSRADWELFRGTFPLHMQTLAVVRDEGKARTLIIAEPPPHVTIESLIAVDPGRLAGAEVMQWTIGFDGWVKDIVVGLPPMSGGELDGLRDRLSEHLFATSYKAYVLELPFDPGSVVNRALVDVRIRPADLQEWYSSPMYAPIGGGKPVHLADAPVGVYLSVEPGLVVWVVPKEHLETRREDARKFALDSDLILGAVARGESVAIFGRERIAPLSLMPPIRTETILDLAAAPGGSLGQSYERTLFGAGAWQDGWDWAPIYLSAQLLDTEYGSLLNQTDQILKGWTECGQIEYHNFPYSPPSRMPFDQSLMQLLGGSSLVYNWNTTGFGVSLQSDELLVYSATRTGALPVMYISGELTGGIDERVAQAEKDAYFYYASLNDPLLARVAQYASLYQIFQACGVTAAGREVPAWDQSAGLGAVASCVVKKLREATPEEVIAAADAEFDAGMAALAALEEPAEAMPFTREEFREHVSDLVELSRTFFDNRENGEETIITLLSRSREHPDAGRAGNDFYAQILASRITSLSSPLRLCGTAELQRIFSASRPAATSGWIRTPTVVLSRGLGPGAAFTGGHDLNSATTRLIGDAGRAVGRPSLDAVGQLVANPEDLRLLSGHAWEIAHTPQPDCAELLKKIIAAGRKETPRSMPQTVGRAEEFRSSVRGLSADVHLHEPALGQPPVPPRKPPAAPGSAPPGDPPPSYRGFQFNEGDRESMGMTLKDNLVVLERRRNGEPAADAAIEVWTDWYACDAIGKELANRSRTLDRKDLVLEFNPIEWVPDGKFDRIERFLDGLTLQLTRARSDRQVILYERVWAPRLSLPVSEKAVASAVTTKVVGTSGGLVDVQIAGNVASTGERSMLRFRVFIADAAAFSEIKAQAAVNGAVKDCAARGAPLGDLPPAIRAKLIEDLEGLAEESGGVFYHDFGDVKPARRAPGALDIIVIAVLEGME